MFSSQNEQLLCYAAVLWAPVCFYFSGDNYYTGANTPVWSDTDTMCTMETIDARTLKSQYRGANYRSYAPSLGQGTATRAERGAPGDVSSEEIDTMVYDNKVTSQCAFFTDTVWHTSYITNSRQNVVHPQQFMHNSADTRLGANVGLMLAQRRRRWANIKPVLVLCSVFAGIIWLLIYCRPTHIYFQRLSCIKCSFYIDKLRFIKYPGLTMQCDTKQGVQHRFNMGITLWVNNFFSTFCIFCLFYLLWWVHSLEWHIFYLRGEDMRMI